MDIAFRGVTQEKSLAVHLNIVINVKKILFFNVIIGFVGILPKVIILQSI